MSKTMSYEVKTPQSYKLNPRKPSVRKLRPGGMWWAETLDADGKYVCQCCHTHADALAKAFEFAAMNAEAAK